jgi:hypothetical protein
LLLLVFLLALLVRLAYAYQIREVPTLHELVADAADADREARAILDRGWPPRSGGAPASGSFYSYLLALVYAVSGRSPAAVRLLQAVAGAGAALLAARAAERLVPAAGRRQVLAAGMAGLLAALYAPAIFHSPLLGEGVPILLLEAAAVVLLLPAAGRPLSPARAAIAGLALGAAALLQAQLLWLVPPAALFVLAGGAWPSRRAPSRSGAPPAAGPPLPARELSAAGAPAVAGEPSFVDAPTPATVPASSARGTWPRALTAALALSVGALAAAWPVLLARHGRGSERPAGCFEAARPGGDGGWARQTRLFWNGYEIPDSESLRVARRESTVLRFDPVVFGVVAPLAALGLLAAARRGGPARRAALLLALLAAATWVALALSSAGSRGRLAVVSFLLPLAGSGALELAEVVAGRRRLARRAALDLALLGAAGLAVNLPCYSAGERRQHDAAVHFNLGQAGLRRAGALSGEFLRARKASGGTETGEARESLAHALALASRAAGDFAEAAAVLPGCLEARLELAAARERRAAYHTLAGRLPLALADYADARRALAGTAEAPHVPADDAEARRALADDAEARHALADEDEERHGPADDDNARRALAALGATGADPALRARAGRLLATVDAGTAAALDELAARLIETRQLDRAEQALDRAVALAPRDPAPRGHLALCRFQLALAARRRGSEREAANLFLASRDTYRAALDLSAAARRGDQEALYRQGLALAEAELARQPPAVP